MKGDLRVDIIVRSKFRRTNWSEYGINEMPVEYVVQQSDDKLILNVPLDWRGFRDGMLNNLISIFDDGVYIALAYIAVGDEIVTDCNGVRVSPFEIVIDGKRVYKYVKKRMRIINVLDEERGTFELKEFMIDMKFIPPIVKILDMYSVGADSELTYEQFVVKEN